jgi:hypothetical protein
MPIRCVTSPIGSTIPDMWRDGIVAAQGDFVALLTAHCIPTRDWLAALDKLQWPESLAGVGGFFVNAPDASALDWAIYLLRYAPYSRPNTDFAVDNIAADNAIYRRREILACPDLLPHGFWEIEYHRQFALRGLQLSLCPDLVVTHRNRYTGAQIAEQRRVHGFNFGRDRTRQLSTARRIAYLVATPAIPLVLLGKVIARAGRYGWLGKLRPAVVGWLVYLCVNWAIGESRGVLSEIRSRTVR